MKRADEEIKAERAEVLARPLQSVRGEQGKRFLVACLGEERYGLPLKHVGRIQACPPLTRLPGAPAHVAGVVSLQGRALTLVDLAVLVGGESAEGGEGGDLLIRVKVHGKELCLRAQAVEGIIRPRPEEVKQPAMSADARLKAEHILGTAPGGLVLLDLARILEGEDVLVGSLQSAQTTGEAQ